MHPKKVSDVTPDDAERALCSIIAAIDELMFTVFGSRWPKANVGIVPSYTL